MKGHQIPLKLKCIYELDFKIPVYVYALNCANISLTHFNVFTHEEQCSLHLRKKSHPASSLSSPPF